jgi:hypothetical protein
MRRLIFITVPLPLPPSPLLRVRLAANPMKSAVANFNDVKVMEGRRGTRQ